MRDNTQKPNQIYRPAVQVFAILYNQNEYTSMGWGYLEIATDIYQYQSHHYIEVAIPNQTQLFLRSRMQLSNEYQRQKNTLILWNDPQQILGNSLALSFEEQADCQSVWKDICSKIGKSNLQILGNQKIDIPNEKNIKIFMQKIKTYHTLVVYYLYKSQEFANAFWQLIQKLKKKTINGYTAIGVIRQLFSQYDTKLFQALFLPPNFQKFLSVYQHETKVNFKKYCPYFQVYQLFKLPERARRKIQVILRAYYIYDYVIQRQNDYILEKMIEKVIPDLQMQILSDMLKQKLMTKLIQIYENCKKQEVQRKNQTIDKLLSFLGECTVLFRKSRAINAKSIYLQLYYKTGVFKLLGELINDGNYKALQMLTYFASMGLKQCLEQLQADYRNNSGKSILRAIIKQYCNNNDNFFLQLTINFVKTFIPAMIKDRSKFEFFDKTIFVSIFMICKQPERILALINIFITQLNLSYQIQQLKQSNESDKNKQNNQPEIDIQNEKNLINGIKVIIQHINKYSYFTKLKTALLQQKLSKYAKIELLRTVRMIMQLYKNQKQPKELVQQINNLVANSGLFEQILYELKRKIKQKNQNIVTSGLMSIIKCVTQMKYNQYVQVCQYFDFTEQIDCKNNLKSLNKIIENSEVNGGDFRKEAKIEQNSMQKTVGLEEDKQMNNQKQKQKDVGVEQKNNDVTQQQHENSKQNQVQKRIIRDSLLRKYVQKILTIKEQKKKTESNNLQIDENNDEPSKNRSGYGERRIYDYYDLGRKRIHRAILQEEQEQKYLQQQIELDTNPRDDTINDYSSNKNQIKTKQCDQNDVIQRKQEEKEVENKNQSNVRQRSRDKPTNVNAKVYSNQDQQLEQNQKSSRISMKIQKQDKQRQAQLQKKVKQAQLLKQKEKQVQKSSSGNKIEEKQLIQMSMMNLIQIKNQIARNYKQQQRQAQKMHPNRPATKGTSAEKCQKQKQISQENYDVFDNL